MIGDGPMVQVRETGRWNSTAVNISGRTQNNLESCNGKKCVEQHEVGMADDTLCRAWPPVEPANSSTEMNSAGTVYDRAGHPGPLR